MPIIVNKEEKIDEICQKAYEEFKKNEIETISLNQLIQKIDISKGQFYHYFKTKEELVFEVMKRKTVEYFNICEKDLEKCQSFEQCLLIFFSVYISNDDLCKTLRKLFFASFHTYVYSKKKEVSQYNHFYYEYVDNKLLNIFKKYEINHTKKEFIKSICATADGMYFRDLVDNSFNLQNELSLYIKQISTILQKG